MQGIKFLCRIDTALQGISDAPAKLLSENLFEPPGRDQPGTISNRSSPFTTVPTAILSPESGTGSAWILRQEIL